MFDRAEIAVLTEISTIHVNTVWAESRICEFWTCCWIK